MQFVIVPHNTPLYWQTVELRTQVLRKPLGLFFTNEQLNAENLDTHIALLNDLQQVIGVLILVFDTQNKKVKMRQVAIHPALQGKGLGTAIVQFAEQYAHKQNYRHLYCHARVSAVNFYEKMQYQTVGNLFTEVGIPHFYMEKKW